MTTRERTVTTVAAKAHNQIERDARANGEHVHQATRRAVQDAVSDATHFDGRFDANGWNWRRFEAAVVRRVEDFADVRRGWWS